MLRAQARLAADRIAEGRWPISIIDPKYRLLKNLIKDVDAVTSMDEVSKPLRPCDLVVMNTETEQQGLLYELQLTLFRHFVASTIGYQSELLEYLTKMKAAKDDRILRNIVTLNQIVDNGGCHSPRLPFFSSSNVESRRRRRLRLRVEEAWGNFERNMRSKDLDRDTLKNTAQETYPRASAQYLQGRLEQLEGCLRADANTGDFPTHRASSLFYEMADHWITHINRFFDDMKCSLSNLLDEVTSAGDLECDQELLSQYLIPLLKEAFNKAMDEQLSNLIAPFAKREIIQFDHTLLKLREDSFNEVVLGTQKATSIWPSVSRGNKPLTLLHVTAAGIYKVVHAYYDVSELLSLCVCGEGDETDMGDSVDWMNC
jgi:hypothetical protein